MSLGVHYDPDLLEEVVQLELRRRAEEGDHGLLREYHRRADPLYHLGGERRESAFTALYRRLFGEKGFEAHLRAIFDGCRALLPRVESLTVLRALRAEEEGADLGRPTPAGRPAVVRLQAIRFLDPDGLDRLLGHELVRLGDLLDPAFGHDPGMLAHVAPARRRLVQERYRVAWAVSIDGRLARRGKAPLVEPAARRLELARAFPGLPGPEVARLFEALWTGDRWSHRDLMAVALRPVAGRPQPGTPCPLCGFPTHRWGEVSDAGLIEAIRRDVPGWRPEDGVCQRCLEAYSVATLVGR